MRQTSFSDLEYSAKRKQTRRARFLAEIEAITPWWELVRVLEPFYPAGKRGRPPIGLERMLRTYVAQQSFSLSDKGAEEAPCDSQAIRPSWGSILPGRPPRTFHGMTWAQRLKRAFGVDIETRPDCGGALRIIAFVEDPTVIKKIPSPGQ